MSKVPARPGIRSYVKKSKCHVCQSEIEENSKKCINCGAYQNKVRDNVLFLASLTGLVTFIVTGAAVSVNQISRFLESRSVDGKLSVSHMQHPSTAGGPGRIIIYNRSPHDIFISSIDYYFLEYSGNSSIVINQTVRGRSTLRFSIEGDTGESIVYGLGAVIANPSGTISDENYRIAMSWNAEKCIIYNVVDDRDPDVIRYNDYYNRNGLRVAMRSVNHANLNFVSPISGEMQSVSIRNLRLMFRVRSDLIRRGVCRYSDWLAP
jgi:hypothetical protein